jgi:hypothetical protein
MINGNRRTYLKLASTCLLATGSGCASGMVTLSERDGTAVAGRLVSRPAHVIKVIDLPREGTQTWFVVLIAEAVAPSIAPIDALECAYLSGANVIRSERYSAAGLAPIMLPLGYPRPRAQTGGPAGSVVYWLNAFRLICRVHSASNIDRMQCHLRLNDGAVLSGEVALQDDYAQRTGLIFPFRGPGLISQAGAANGGHRNVSGMFALDALALADNYGPQLSSASDSPQDYAGYGRQLYSPAAGVVVHARGDRPDQPRAGEVSNEYLLPEDPEGDPGNHVIIDHENGEFSMVAHLQAGSLSVSGGERVAQAQPIGRLGNSGNSFGPHVHYQLQDGPDRHTAAGLPCSFTNVSVARLDRGAFFMAR